MSHRYFIQNQNKQKPKNHLFFAWPRRGLPKFFKEIRMAKPEYDNVSKFAEIQSSLLQLERDEEIQRTKDLLLSSDSEKFSFKRAHELEKKGLGFRKLTVSEWTTSAFGNNLITLGKQDQSELTASTFSNGEFFSFFV